MVMAGKVTYLWAVWSRPLAVLGVLLLQAGSAVRAGLERATRIAEAHVARRVGSAPRVAPRVPEGRDALCSAAHRRAVVRPPTPQRRLVVQAEPAFRTAERQPLQRPNSPRDAASRGRRSPTSTTRSVALPPRRCRAPALARPVVPHRPATQHPHRPPHSVLRRSGARPAPARHGARVDGAQRRRRTRSGHRVASATLAHRLLMRNLDGILALTEGGLDAARAAYPELRDVPGAVTRHGHYRRRVRLLRRPRGGARAARTRRRRCRVVAIGRSDPSDYKNVPHLVEHLPPARLDRACSWCRAARRPRSPTRSARLPEMTRGSASTCRSCRDDELPARIWRPPTSSCCRIGESRTRGRRSWHCPPIGPCWCPISVRCGNCRPTWAMSGCVCTTATSTPSDLEPSPGVGGESPTGEEAPDLSRLRVGRDRGAHRGGVRAVSAEVTLHATRHLRTVWRREPEA